MIVTASARHDLPQLNGRIEKILELPTRLLDNNPADQMWLLRRDHYRTIIGMAGRIAIHPIACIAELESAIASAPSAIAFMKSGGLRRPPVMTRVTSFFDELSKWRLARPSAGIVGTEILSGI